MYYSFKLLILPRTGHTWNYKNRSTWKYFCSRNPKTINLTFVGKDFCCNYFLLRNLHSILEFMINETVITILKAFI